ncbi:MAG: hypothetical protein Tsb0021_10400 [Chlamydiales bacterium]
MIDQDSFIEKHPNPLIRELTEALKCIENFNFSYLSGSSAKSKKEQSPHASALDRSRNVFNEVFQTVQSNNMLDSRTPLFQAIDFLKRHYKLILNMKESGPDEKKWAEWALRTIQTYNELIERVRPPKMGLRDRVKKFVLGQSRFSVSKELVQHKISIPLDRSFYYSSQALEEEAFQSFQENQPEKLVSYLLYKEHPLTALSKQETDIFRMKTISLANSSEIPLSLRESLHEMLWNTPIESMEGKESQNSGISTVTAVQTLHPFPGEIIKVYGAFQRDRSSRVPSVPKSFKVISAARQTGFPDPKQYTGFTFDHALIPEFPNRLDLIPHFQALLEKKQELAAELLPLGKYNKPAKNYLIHHKELFFKQQGELFFHLENLMTAIITHHPYIDESSEQDILIVKSYYEDLENDFYAFENMINTHRTINKLFISEPYHRLHHSWLEEGHELLIEKEEKKRYLACLALFETHQQKLVEKIHQQIDQTENKREKITLEYILTLGKVIGKASSKIVLQYLSEKILFAPPLLNEFERKVQICTYQQLITFIKSFDVQVDEIDDLTHVLQLLQNEKEIFEGEETPLEEESLQVVNELESYFNTRHFNV